MLDLSPQRCRWAAAALAALSAQNTVDLKLLVAALQLIVLHRVDGGEVLVNPAHVASLMVAADHSKVVAPGVHCAVGLTGGKYLFVMESCAEVRRKLEGSTP